VSTLILLTATGLGLAALYFFVASGLTLIFGLMDVLNFAHGAFVAVGGYVAWWAATGVGGNWGLLAGLLAGTAAGAGLAVLVETSVIRALYKRPFDQVLATVGLGLALPALLQAIAGSDPKPWTEPAWLSGTVTVLGAHVPLERFAMIGSALLLFGGLNLMLVKTRVGLIVRAGVENREMVTALGIDVRTAFTAVFALGGAAAGLAGMENGLYAGSVSPGEGTSLLIFAFVVVVIGGLGSIRGTALAAVVVGLVQQFANYYGPDGLGSESVVILLAAVLLARRRDLQGKPA
jgi:branched-chain amino acid transport system permease protein